MTTYDDYDELASAYLDGETTDDETARVEADPELMARVNDFRLLAGAVAQPVDLPDEAIRQAAIAAAIAQGAPGNADTATTTSTATQTDTPEPENVDHTNVRSLAEGRANRAQRNTSWLSVAAGFAAVIIGGALIWAIAASNRDSDSAVTDTAMETESVQVASDAASDATDAISDDSDAIDDEADEADEAMVEEAAMDDGDADQRSDAANSAVSPEAADDQATTGESSADETDESGDADLDSEPRKGDDDDGIYGSGADAAGNNAVLTLPALLQSLADPDQLESPSAGLFESPIDERSDFLGVFDTAEALIADPGLADGPTPDPAAVAGADCLALAERLLVADSPQLLATAQLLDPVTGANIDIALVQITTADGESLLGLDLAECRVLIGQDDLP